MIRFEEVPLPPFLSYVSARLTGRPLDAVIWLIAMLMSWVGIYLLDKDRGPVGDIIIAMALLFIAGIGAALVSVATRFEGRRWLIKKYNCDANTEVSTGSRIIIRALPLIGVLVVLEYVLFMK